MDQSYKIIDEVTHQKAACLVKNVQDNYISYSRKALLRNLQEIAANTDSVRVGLGRGVRLYGLATIIPSEWDSRHFDFSLAKCSMIAFEPTVMVKERLKLIRACRRRFLAKGWALVIFRVPLSDTMTIQSLEAGGCVLTDVLMTFHRNCNSTNLPSKKGIVSAATPADIDAVSKLSRESMTHDHFHFDTRIPREKSDDLYELWARNLCVASKGVVLVAKKGREVVGFVTCSVEEEGGLKHGVIDLIAISEFERSRGIGTILLGNAINWFSKRVNSVFVGTQASNIGAMRLYQKTGFGIIDSEVTLHLWV